jgi:outer membrane protein insertion porin family
MRILVVSLFAVASLLPADSGPYLVKSVSIRGTTAHVDLATQVGQAYDTAIIDKDVHQLWNTGRFSDIRVERVQEADGAGIIFQVVETQTKPLHKILIEPSTFGLQLTLPEGTPIDRVRAHEIARQAREELKARGFQDVSVDDKLVPYVDNLVDLDLHVEPGDRVRVEGLKFVGDIAIEPKELQRTIQALRVKRVLPAIPGLWSGWRLFPAYSAEAVQSDVARLRSLYLSKGYLEASVRWDDVEARNHQARITILIQAGPLYRVRGATIAGGVMKASAPGDLCPNLLAQRRVAERQGILDFAVTLDARRVEGGDDAHPLVDLAAAIDRGRSYRVGRIEFSGHHHYSEAMLRRNLLLDEGQLLDERLLRRSLGRLNQAMLFDPIGEHDVHVRTNPATGVADLRIDLHEHKGGAWNLSGPVGPASFAGPLEASLRSRLPSWGAGLFELSTWTAAISMYAFAPPLVPIASFATKHPFLPVLALQRPFLPGEGWKSGFYVAPQLGWRALGLSYSLTQVQQRLLPLLAGDRGLVPELPVIVETPRGEAQMFCEPPQPRLMPLRTAASLVLRFAGAFTGL